METQGATSDCGQLAASLARTPQKRAKRGALAGAGTGSGRARVSPARTCRAGTRTCQRGSSPANPTARRQSAAKSEDPEAAAEDCRRRDAPLPMHSASEGLRWRGASGQPARVSANRRCSPLGERARGRRGQRRRCPKRPRGGAKVWRWARRGPLVNGA